MFIWNCPCNSGFHQKILRDSDNRSQYNLPKGRNFGRFGGFVKNQQN